MVSHQPRYGRRPIRSGRLPSSATQLERHRIRNSPHSHESSSWLVVSSCVSAPVCGSRFFETLVRTLEWNACVARFMAAPFGVVFVCMAAMFGFPLFPVHVQFFRSRI
jgi:hypothetical protein